MPDDPTLAAVRHRLAAEMLQAQETLAPIYDAADGVKADMISRGWSPQNAEAAALSWLQGVLPTAFR